MNSKRKGSWGGAIIGILIIAVALINIILVSGDRANLMTRDVPEIKIDKSSNNSQLLENVYTNTKYNFSIQFPEGGKIEDGYQPHVIKKATLGSSSINVRIEEFSSENFNSIIEAGALNDFVELYSKTLSGMSKNISVVGSNIITINNNPAYLMEFLINVDRSYNAEQIHFGMYVMAKGTITYAIGCGTSTADYAQIRHTIENSIATFNYG